MSSHAVMKVLELSLECLIAKVAEDLYNRGIISYPRTETDVFENAYDLKEIINQQTSHNEWGSYANMLLNPEMSKYQWPRQGKHNDSSHPPIHPTKLVNDLHGDEKKVYELVCRRFLACCSKNATGNTNTVGLNMGNEEFTASGTLLQ
jgi:DNA topoisomerase-3